MNPPNRSYFQLQQAQEVAEVFAKHKVELNNLTRLEAVSDRCCRYESTTPAVRDRL